MQQPSPSKSDKPYRTKNRFLAALCHTNRYSGRFHRLLSRDTGIEVRLLRKILRGECEPHYLAVLRLWEAITKFSGRDLPLVEFIVPIDEDFPTQFICELFRCNCLPPWAYTKDGSRHADYTGLSPGCWEFSVTYQDSPNQLPS